MKKLILLLGILSMGFQCEDDEVFDVTQWGVRNNTDQTIKLKYPDIGIETSQLNYDIQSLNPGRSFRMYSADFKDAHRLPFNYYFNEIVKLYGEDISWQILSEDDVVLKTWNYSERGLPNQQFFEEAEWNNQLQPGILSTWTFEILPDHIH